jgi:hypothetical protein
MIPVAQPFQPPPAQDLVFHQPLERNERGVIWTRLIPAWIISGVIHTVLLSLFLVITTTTAVAVDKVDTIPAENRIDEDEAWQDKNLTNDEIGNDPELPTNYNVDRVADISVPGPVNPNENVGILNAPQDAPPTTVPPPPGFGGGQGGGVDAERPGTGALQGFAGGFGGQRMVPGGFGGRSGATREKMLREGGGNTKTEAAVARGLAWLARHQAIDGHWGLDDFAKANKCSCTGAGPYNPIAGTAFALLPFLGAGETHKAVAGNNKYAKFVDRGLRYLIAHQAPDGSFTDSNGGACPGAIYTQGLAGIALCEAYGLTSDPNLKPYAQRALDYIVSSQNTIGGWDYAPRGPEPDTSISGWQTMAIKSGQIAGLRVPPATIKGINNWLDWAQSPEDPSVYGYRKEKAMNPSEGGASPQTMIPIGLLCRMYVSGWGARHPAMTRGAEWLTRPENMPLKNNRRHMYYFYYGTQVLHHMSEVNSGPWQKWNTAMRDLLVDEQDQGSDPEHRDQKGSWDAKPDWWCQYGGRIMMTSMCLLTLEVYYRHLPIYRREIGSDKPQPGRNGM